MLLWEPVHSLNMGACCVPGVCSVCHFCPVSNQRISAASAPATHVTRCAASARAVQATAAALKAGASSLDAARAGIMASHGVHGGCMYVLMVSAMLAASKMSSALGAARASPLYADEWHGGQAGSRP